MIEDILKNKYGDFIDGLDIYENTNSLILSRIVIKKGFRNTGIGTKILEDLIKYADANKQLITLTPASDFGGSKNRLIQFYKRFGFRHNSGNHKSYLFNQSMIRYPKLNENMKSEIKKILKEGFINEYNAPSDCDCCSYFDFNSLKNIYSGLEHPLYNIINKNKLYKLIYISPKEYLVKVANNFKTTYDYMINCGIISQKLVDKYAEAMKNGDKFPIIYYTVNSSAQEGRHRALACLKLGCKLIPVVTISELNSKKILNMIIELKGLSFEEVDNYFKNLGYDGISDLDYRELNNFFKYRMNESTNTIKYFLNESLFNRHSIEQIELMNEFITFACNFLKIPETKVILKFTHEGLVTTAAYGEKKVHVYAKERAVVDIMRSIAHELTHMMQDLEGRLNQLHHDDNNKAGSPIENEANYKAGEIIRKFGEIHPNIYI